MFSVLTRRLIQKLINRMRFISIWHGAVFEEYQKRYRELVKLGYDVTLIAPRRWSAGLPAPTTLKRLPNAEFEIIGLPTYWSQHGATFFYYGLPKQLVRIQPRIIECIEEPYSLAAFLTTRWRQKYAPQAKLIVSTCQNIYKNYPLPVTMMEQYVLNHADALTGLNAESLEVFRAKGFDKPTAVMPTGIDLDAYPMRTDPRHCNNPPRAGYAGRIVEEKGLSTLLRAINSAKTPYRLVVAGRGPARGSLETLARTLNIADRVKFMDAIPHGKMAEFYQSLDVFVLPSLTRPNWKEQFGRVLVEAMACGTNVVGSNSGEIPNVIGDAGLIYPENDALALAWELDRLALEAGLRKHLRLSGRKVVESKYSWKAVAIKLHSLLQNII